MQFGVITVGLFSKKKGDDEAHKSAGSLLLTSASLYRRLDSDWPSKPQGTPAVSTLKVGKGHHCSVELMRRPEDQLDHLNR